MVLEAQLLSSSSSACCLCQARFQGCWASIHFSDSMSKRKKDSGWTERPMPNRELPLLMVTPWIFSYDLCKTSATSSKSSRPRTCWTTTGMNVTSSLSYVEANKMPSGDPSIWYILMWLGLVVWMGRLSVAPFGINSPRTFSFFTCFHPEQLVPSWLKNEISAAVPK